MAMKQRYAKILLQPADLAADGRLAKAQRFTRMGKAASASRLTADWLRPSVSPAWVKLPAPVG